MLSKCTHCIKSISFKKKPEILSRNSLVNKGLISFQLFCLACEPHKYGQECTLDCGHCKEGRSCSMDTGACPDGCDGGWIGERCDTGISYNIPEKMQQIIYFLFMS